ncbi:hypothetical protein F5Y09DRAFT_304866 [Xylaria sp. FL1042]|nr:hypothetical protein F5Y09DRAFT_304866 [Xylaria sp. FL1042]
MAWRATVVLLVLHASQARNRNIRSWVTNRCAHLSLWIRGDCLGDYPTAIGQKWSGGPSEPNQFRAPGSLPVGGLVSNPWL